ERPRRGEWLRAGVPRQVGNDERAPAEQRHELAEVPGRPAESVDEQDRPSVPAPVERPHGEAADLVERLLEAGEQVGRIRHLDRLWWGHLELCGDSGTGRVKTPVLRREELET